ncbi:delta(3,5)-Delta(2,4)-dienoyl-CoA isomerase, mitochondrial-like isoform X4 [Daphnia carinata]|uniref:delta(3,5)-Delta(2,4)-dienoyl-CoA isomerase, mitochondrial-like isoform X4 n=1 Tax=Daphnia carinata TaxID=120202 RepID=UPI00257E2381|nr:delta(3,5)-Delta(2,4)-dienoyl-CoA isomerase, mitochondrial-like isoform X4 [Daphnia carinata]
MQSVIKLLGQAPVRTLHTTAVIMATSSFSNKYKFETLLVSTPREYVYHVELNRPQQFNAMNSAFWREMVECFQTISEDSDCRAVVLSATGKHFTAGLDLTDMGPLMETVLGDGDVARKFRTLQQFIKSYQLSFTSVEQCNKPVIAAVHGGCIGGGVDLITAADIRFCTQDAFFQIKEVDIGLAADVGTLQRLPKVIGSDSLVRELAYTARKMFADEAAQAGLVSRVLSDKNLMLKAALETASTIADKSPVAVQGSKHNLNYARDHSVEEGLNYMVVWNAAMLQSEDLRVAAMASTDRKGPPPVFSKL